MQLLKEKKRKNIVEYVIYLWHVEDLLRSVNFDIKAIEKGLIQQQSTPDTLDSVTKWYTDYILLMQQEHVVNKGHTSMVHEAISELGYLHNSLLTIYQDKKYMEIYEQVKPALDDLRQKSADQRVSPIEMCLNGIYGVLILKLKGKQITTETADAVQKFTELMNYLAIKYRDVQEGKPMFSASINN